MKHESEWYWNRAKLKFKTLVIYFCVTRPQYEKEYHDKNTGKFSVKELLRQMDFLDKWDKQTYYFRNKYARVYAHYSKTYNYTFSIPSALVKEILGKCKDESGKFKNVPINKLVKELEDEGFLKVRRHGTKTHKGDDGKYHVDCWWGNKYLLADKDLWLKLISDSNYSDYMKYPEDDDGFVAEVREKIAKWRTRSTSRQNAKEDVAAVLKSFSERKVSPHDAVYELSKLGVSEERALDILNEIWKRMNQFK